MKSKLSVFVFLSLVTALVAEKSWAGPHLSILGTATYSKPTSDGVTYSSKMGLGGGLLLEFPIGQRIGFELGGLYLNRKYSDGARDVSTTTIQIPVMLRFWFGRFLSIAAGGYGATGLNDIKFGDGSSASFADYGIKKTDFGVIGGLRYSINVSPGTALFIDGRYSKSLTNVASGGGSFKYGDFQGLIGLTFGMNKTR